jgi:hypothetical protein
MKLSTIYKRAADGLISDGEVNHFDVRSFKCSTYRFTCNAISAAQGMHWQDDHLEGITTYHRNKARTQYANLFSPVPDAPLSLFHIQGLGGVCVCNEEAYLFRHMLLLMAWQEALAHGE